MCQEFTHMSFPFCPHTSSERGRHTGISIFLLWVGKLRFSEVGKLIQSHSQ